MIKIKKVIVNILEIQYQQETKLRSYLLNKNIKNT